MEYGSMRRSGNVEGQPNEGELQSLINRLIGQPMAAYHDLMSHPFTTPDKYYADEYAKNNPNILDKSQMAKGLGIADVGKFGAADPSLIQQLLNQLDPDYDWRTGVGRLPRMDTVNPMDELRNYPPETDLPLRKPLEY